MLRVKALFVAGFLAVAPSSSNAFALADYVAECSAPTGDLKLECDAYLLGVVRGAASMDAVHSYSGTPPILCLGNASWATVKNVAHQRTLRDARARYRP